MKHSSDRERMETWAVQSPEEPGFHAVITPQTRSAGMRRSFG